MGTSENGLKVLPISEKPFIRAYPEFAFVDMISNNELRAGKTIFKGSSSEDFDKEWTIDKCESEIRLSGNSIEIEEPFYASKHIKRIWRKAAKEDCLILKIDYQQDTNRWDSAGIFFDVRKDSYGDFTEHIAAGTNFCGETLMARINNDSKFISVRTYEDKYPLWMKAEVSNDIVTLSYSISEGEWTKLVSENISQNDEQGEYVIGFYFSMAERQYYKWIFNNFMNYRLDMQDRSVLKYTGIMRDSKHYSINPLIRFSDEYYSILKELGGNLIKFIEANVDRKRYVEFWLNERYIPGLEAFNYTDHYHEGIVYGYDSAEKILHMVFFLGGKPKCLEVSEKDFLNAYYNSENPRANRIFLLEYYPSNKAYELDILKISDQLKIYLAGENPTQEYCRFIGKEDGVFGIDCYDFFLSDEEAFQSLLKDIRVSYLIREHKACMYERVKYLIEMGIIKKNQKELTEAFGDIYHEAKVLANWVIKSKYDTEENCCFKIRSIIDTMREKEKMWYQKLIESLDV